MSLVDANVILRYLLDDHAELSAKAAEIVEHHSVSMTMEVGCEVVYVLQKVYGIERTVIQQHLNSLLNEDLVGMEKSGVFRKALEYFSQTRLDFVDTVLLAYQVIEQQKIYTFDNKLLKFINKIP